MTSYIDHHHPPRYVAGRAPDLTVTVDWHAFTERRLAWLYGPLHASERAAQTRADIAAWRRLGTRPAA